MIAKVIAIVSLIILPPCLVLWYRSHSSPEQRRWDMTLYKSLWLYMEDGICAVHVLNLPLKTPSRSRFLAEMNPAIIRNKGRLHFSSFKDGPYRHLWLIFPWWLPTTLLLLTLTSAILYGPLRARRRRLKGWCVECGYDLAGNRTGRCPECGSAVRRRSDGRPIPDR
jgi:hypothetical protein